MPKKTGFTLIELLIVIAIIAILSVIAIVVFSNLQKGVRDAKRKADINALYKALEIRYNFTNDQYPSSIEAGWFGADTKPMDPLNHDYNSQIAYDKKSFKVCAALEDHPTRSCDATSSTCFCRQSSRGQFIPPTISGQVYNSTVADIMTACSGTPWTNSQNVLSSDDNYATVSRGGLTYSNCIRVVGFGFSVPNDAVINGIEADIEGKSATMDQSLNIFAFYDGDIRNPRATSITTTEGYVSVGGSTDLWGEPVGFWTPAIINHNKFGVAVRVDPDHDDTVNIDHVRLKIYYSMP